MLSKDRHLEHDWFVDPVPGNVSIGNRSWLYSSYAFRHYRSDRPTGVTIGEDSGLYNGTFFDLGPEGSVLIGNYCTLVGAIICTNGRVEIGDYSFIAHEVVLADTPFAIPFSKDSDAGFQEKEILIGDNVWIGARATILAGARIGEGSIIGAAAVIDFEVPPYSIAAGNPARVVGKIDS